MNTVGSLFSGIGGMELGLERTGDFETIWFSELEPYASAVLRKHWPRTPNLGDITKINWKEVQRPDILTGGFPCQDISNAGKRAGIKGKRSSLWKEYLKAISILLPRAVIIENVAALLRRGMDTVLCDLAKIGYDAEWHCIPAASIGAPHRRDRVFILAYPNNCRCLDKESKKLSAEGREQTQYQSLSSSKNVAHSDSRIVEGNWAAKVQESYTSQEKILLRQHRTRNRTGQWKTEPCLGRMADGVPNWVDRIKCLGNAIVPQVAEYIGELVLQRIKEGEYAKE